ncbi:FOCAD protein, partial [Polypterus senegalus]
MQGNSILALTGLAVAVAKYESSLPTDIEGNPEKSYSGENTASAIARSCASLALSLMVPVLITTYNESIVEILNILCLGLPGKQNADESQAVQFHTGLALGMFLSSLYEEHAREEIITFLCGSKQKKAETHLSRILDNNFMANACFLSIFKHLNDLNLGLQGRDKNVIDLVEHMRAFQVLAYSVACVTVSAFNASILDGEKAEEVMNQLRAMTEQNQQGCPTMQRLAALNGLVALVGSESSLIQLKLEAGQSSQYQSRLNEVIRAITQVISFSGAIGLQSNASCLIGHLYLANSSSSQSRTSVPPDFGYLNEKSVVRAFLDYIISAGKKGPEFIQPHLVKVALGPLSSVGKSHQYPPVNWAAVLSPLIRLNFGEDVQQLCIELAVTQCQSSQTASMFLGMWLVPPLINSLSESDFELYMKLSKCLSEMADTEIDRITQVNKDNNLKMTFVRAYLVSQGRVPLLCLNDTIAPSTAVNHPNVICWFLLLSFYQCRLTVNTNTGVLQRMEWLLELMGHIRNIAYESTHLEHGDIKEDVKSDRENEGVEEPSDIEEGGLNLSVPFRPISAYITDRKEMLEQCFRVIGEKTLQKMLPDELKNCSYDEIKKLCMDQLEQISEKNLLQILEGPASGEESDALSINADTYDSDIEGHKEETEEKEKITEESDTSAAKIQNPDPKKELQNDIEKSVNEILALTVPNQVDPKSVPPVEPVAVAAEALDTNKPLTGLQPSVQQLELLELEMRARAIKALMKANEAKKQALG